MKRLIPKSLRIMYVKRKIDRMIKLCMKESTLSEKRNYNQIAIFTDEVNVNQIEGIKQSISKCFGSNKANFYTVFFKSKNTPEVNVPQNVSYCVEEHNLDWLYIDKNCEELLKQVQNCSLFINISSKSYITFEFILASQEVVKIGLNDANYKSNYHILLGQNMVKDMEWTMNNLLKASA